MNIFVKASLLGVGGLLLFGGVYIGVAKSRGADMHSLPVVGALFAAPPDAEPDESDTHANATHTESPAAASPTPRAPAHEGTRTAPARAGLLDAFSLETPFAKHELEQLVESLKNSQRDSLERLEAIAAREKVLDERETALDERQQTLERLKLQLDAATREQSELLSASAEDAETRKLRMQETWATRGSLFAEGEADRLVERLQGYSAADAAHVLATLDPARARELLDALPPAKWREYAEAYSARIAAQSVQKD